MTATAPCRTLPVLLGGVLFFSGCVSVPFLQRPPAAPAALPRTELVLLNVNEASGWVAYAGEKGASAETEEYRIVVIRTRNGELIYDSTVPLATDLHTHGFEMDANDPRLRRMADSVDRNVIAPLEAFQQTQAPATPAPPPPPNPPTAPAEKAPAAEPPAPTAAANLPFSIATLAEKSLSLRLERNDSVQLGQRFFVRTPDRSIRLPGFEENVTAPGEVVGLVEITALQGLDATASLISGEIPANALLEAAVSE